MRSTCKTLLKFNTFLLIIKEKRRRSTSHRYSNMSNMIKCSCWAVDIKSKNGNHPKSVWHKNYVPCVIKEDLPKEFPKMKNYSTKSPSDDFLQGFAQLKYDSKLTEPNIQL